MRDLVRPAVVVVVVLALLAGGCSSLVARKHGSDLSVLREGAPRAQVEMELGNGGREEALPGGRTLVLYRCVVVSPRDRERHRRHGEVHGHFRSAFRAAPVVDVAGLGPQPVQLAWRAAVGAVWLVADGAMATSEILQRRGQRREVAVTYDGDDRVVEYRLPRG